MARHAARRRERRPCLKAFGKKLTAFVLCLTVLCGQAFALSAPERYRRAVTMINSRGLIAETNPVSQETMETDMAYLETNPDALSRLLNDILSGMDTHSMYLTAAQYQSGFSTLSGYAGVGVKIRKTARGNEIIEVTRNSPAEAAGIQTGDLLIDIDGTDVTGMSLYELSTRMQGVEGTEVQVTIEREGTRRDYTLTRATIHQSSVSTMEAAPGVQYIAVSAFSDMEDAEDFLAIWDSLPEKGVKAVILDLRGNGGGIIDCAFKMLNGMLEKKTLMASLQWRVDQGGVQKEYAKGGGLPLNAVTVLVDSGTASAAELMAGVLQEAGGATLVGDRTYGKGQGQYHMTVDGDYLVLTCLEMLLPKSGAWEGKGLTPDVRVQAERTMAGYLETAAPLDLTAKTVYGQQSEQVRAMSQRLHALGYLSEPDDVFDTTVLGALRRFQSDCGLEPMIYADETTLRVLSAKCLLAAEQDLSIDDVYYAALGLCCKAAEKPARYQTTADGGWKAA